MVLTVGSTLSIPDMDDEWYEKVALKICDRFNNYPLWISLSIQLLVDNKADALLALDNYNILKEYYNQMIIITSDTSYNRRCCIKILKMPPKMLPSRYEYNVV